MFAQVFTGVTDVHDLLWNTSGKNGLMDWDKDRYMLKVHLHNSFNLCLKIFVTEY